MGMGSPIPAGYAVVSYTDVLLGAGVLVAGGVLVASLLDIGRPRTRGILALSLGTLLAGLFATQDEYTRAALALFVTAALLVSVLQRRP